MAFTEEVLQAKGFVIEGRFYNDILYNSSNALHFWSAGTILVMGELKKIIIIYLMRNSRSFLT